VGGGVAALAVVVAIATFGSPSATNVGDDPVDVSPPPESDAVLPVLVGNVAIIPGDTVRLFVGGDFQLEARASGTNGQPRDSVDVSWVPMNAQIALVSPTGLVTAVTRGVAEIRALVDRGDGGDPVSASVWVVVSASELVLVNEEPVEEPEPELPLITRLVISPDVDTLRVGDRLPLGVVAETAAGDPVSGQDVTWDVSDTDVARVEGAGAQVIVVAMSPGSVLVQATIGGVEGVARLEVIATVTALGPSSPDRDTVAVLPPPEPPVDDRPADPEDPADGYRTATEVDSLPVIQNSAAVASAIREEYPSFLRDAGITGFVRVAFSLNAAGEVVDFQVIGSTRDTLEEPARRVAEVYEFSPAMDDGVAVPVRFEFDIRFGL